MLPSNIIILIIAVATAPIPDYHYNEYEHEWHHNQRKEFGHEMGGGALGAIAGGLIAGPPGALIGFGTGVLTTDILDDHHHHH
jgi:hypothetical protein